MTCYRISSQFSYRVNWNRCTGLYFKNIKRSFGSSLKKKKAVNLSYASYENPEESTKPPIFIFHGILANKTQWEDIGKTILRVTGRRVVAVDLRNHGNSPHCPHKYVDQAYDVLKLLDKLKVTQASLIGHCIGGRIAMCVALIAPRKVAGLLVVDISPISTPPSFVVYMPKILTSMASVNFKNVKNISTAKIEARKQLNKTVGDDLLMNDILSNVRIKVDGTIGWICNLDVLLKDYRYWTTFPRVSGNLKYKGPTLFLGGQLSEFIPPDDLNDVRTLFPSAVITYLNNAGHYLQVEDPLNFLQITVSFLRRHRYKNNKVLHQSLLFLPIYAVLVHVVVRFINLVFLKTSSRSL
ncbi:unnamed protein product [Arctia plantaginis]|uniref:sn-1-specific diacylglycerol lipase ABHD11 n=1 Tax=Arctia plantaginis TaxID=874455 RepID=A0A8S0YQJ3_ARCPL|nr:unnamed protein product [Arctia plantaginis]CAB3246402.1 unnamed protein product [Arctia plantaginis]